MLFVLALSKPDFKHYALHDISKMIFDIETREEPNHQNTEMHDDFSQCIQGLHFLCSQRDIDFYSITDKEQLPLRQLIPRPCKLFHQIKK